MVEEAIMMASDKRMEDIDSNTDQVSISHTHIDQLTIKPTHTETAK